MKNPKRKVTKTETRHFSQGSNVKIILECGHYKVQKGSASIPSFCYCKECPASKKEK
ncbi:MAG: hypothetical protein M0P71_12925 [Melioribacteraceae bacterium]|jgi:hypothetical protein|nr:hypothetical protein [Melioribacteraceae bacterium]